jgi:hypothetical protein
MPSRQVNCPPRTTIPARTATTGLTQAYADTVVSGRRDSLSPRARRPRSQSPVPAGRSVSTVIALLMLPLREATSGGGDRRWMRLAGRISPRA